jgi:hypothetical protein
MSYKGHVENGVVVLDDPAPLKEGMRVTVLPDESEDASSPSTPLRGTTYRFDDPFAPAADPDDWDANQ